MDGLFKLLWPMSHHSGPTVDIPTYQQGEGEDQVDLQIKSLLYMFRRCNIATSEQFISKDELPSRGLRDQRSIADLRVLAETHKNALNKYSNDGLHGISLMDKQKLDLMYSKSQFEKVLSNDEHRVLIDWIKNKFRSLCILSGPPKEMDSLPSFESPNFHFIIIPADSTDEEYIRLLSCSDLYIEHSFTLAQRQKIIKELLYSIRSEKAKNATGTENSSSYTFTKDDRAFIIYKYLITLATEVQVERLYRATLRAKQQQQQQQQQQHNSPTHDSFNDRPTSPHRNHIPASPEHNRRRSPERLSNESPLRSKSRSPERLSNGSGNGNKVYVHGYNPLNGSISPKNNTSKLSSNPSPKHTPKLSSYPSLPTLSSVTTRSPSRSVSRSPSPIRSPIFESESTSPASSPRNPAISPTTNRLRSKASSLSLRKPIPELNPLALTRTTDNVSPALRRETMEQARFAVRSRIEREKSLLKS